MVKDLSKLTTPSSELATWLEKRGYYIEAHIQTIRSHDGSVKILLPITVGKIPPEVKQVDGKKEDK